MFLKWVGFEYLVWASENQRARAGDRFVAESRVAHNGVADPVCILWLKPHLAPARSSATDLRAAGSQDQGPPNRLPKRPLRPRSHDQEGRKFPRDTRRSRRSAGVIERGLVCPSLDASLILNALAATRLQLLSLRVALRRLYPAAPPPGFRPPFLQQPSGSLR